MEEQNNNSGYGSSNTIGGIYGTGNINGQANAGSNCVGNAGISGNASLPQEVTVWSKIKSFLLQDVNQDIVVTMTPYQAKVLKEVHDFWFQEVNFGKVRDFLFQEITFGSKK